MRHRTSLYQKIKQEKLLAMLVVVFWLFLFSTTASKTYLYFVRQSIPIEMDYILLRAFLIWGVAAMFAPVFIWVSRKIPIEGDKAFRNAAFHVFFSLLFVPVHAFVFRLVMYLRYYILEANNMEWDWGTFYESYLMVIVSLAVVGPLSYWLIVGVYHLKRYYTQFKERKLKNLEMEAELSSIRLHVLKVQLHPHFLFNTLHNVNSLIHDDPDTAERILVLLKRFLLISIKRMDEQQVPLMDEIEFTGTYLEIEKTRFSNRLTIETDIKEVTLDAKVPSLILQPLVENAVRHGISKRMRPGIVKITSQKAGDSLILSIEDDGPGLNGIESMNSEGIGLKNIRQRLSQLYPESVFELSASPLGGLRVQIEIPFERYNLKREKKWQIK